MRRFLCLFLPRWPLQRLYLTLPEARGKAVALFERTAHGSRVAVCSGEANRTGIRAGMSVADARVLAKDLSLHEADFGADRAALETLALWATRFSPLVSIERDGAHIRYPQSLLLETTGCEDVFGGEDALLRLALLSLKKLRYKVRAAFAPTPGAAWALAHYGTAGATVANDPAALRAALEGLPLAALRLNSETLDDLRPLGLNRIGDVLRQPRATLPSRFGPLLLERIDQALGTVPEVLPLLRPAPEYRAACAFEYPVRNWELLFNMLEKKVAALAKTLQQAERGARQLECWLYHEMAEPICAEVTLHRSSASRKHLWQLLRARLEGVFRTPHAPLKNGSRRAVPVRSDKFTLEAEEGICAVALQVPSTEPLNAGELALFEREADEQNGTLALLLDRLVTRLGPAAVGRVQLEDDPIPERSYRMLTLEQQPAARHAATQVLERPLALLPEPVPIHVEWPRAFVWKNVTHTVRAARGPERIESGWWRDEYTRRDYFIAETEQGLRFWIFQRRTDGRWFMHGEFE